MADSIEHPMFTSADYDFELFDDGSWKAWSDGVVVANGAFRRFELSTLAEDLMRIDISRVGLYDNDRAGEQ